MLSNEFASLYQNPDAAKSIESAISILRFCSQNDKQAERVLYIVESFDKANRQRALTARKPYLSGRKAPIIATLSQNSGLDPIDSFFHLGSREAMHVPATTFGGDTVLVATTPVPMASMSMIPPSIQQPSPDGSLSMSSGVTSAAGIAQGVDALSGADSEFDLDIIWDGWRNGPNIPTTIHQQQPGAFGPYSLGHSQAHAPGPSVMYHPSEFR